MNAYDKYDEHNKMRIERRVTVHVSVCEFEVILNHVVGLKILLSVPTYDHIYTSARANTHIQKRELKHEHTHTYTIDLKQSIV